MNIFKRTPKKTLADLMLMYIKETLPVGVMAYQPVTNNNKIAIVHNSTSLSFDLEDEGVNVDMLSPSDRKYINEKLLVPALEHIDKELLRSHNGIKATLEKIKSVDINS